MNFPDAIFFNIFKKQAKLTGSIQNITDWIKGITVRINQKTTLYIHLPCSKNKSVY